MTDAALPESGPALDRLTRGQALALDLIEALLQAPEPDTDAAVQQALAGLGRHLGSDRTYVFRLRGDGRMDNTHEWVADGIAPMRDRLQDVPVDLAPEWFAAFARGEAVEIADVDALPDSSEVKAVLQPQGIRSLLVVPMRADGRLTGFAGYDSVRRPRRFLAGEIRLLRSVANAIDRVLNARDARRASARAHAALADETDRLRATLQALPDLVLELDADRRFVAFHAGDPGRLAVPAADFIGRRPEDVLPPEVAAVAHRGMAAIDASDRCEALTYALDAPDGRRWYSATGARRAADARGGYVFVVRDITREELQRREIARLGEVARRTTNLVAVTDCGRRIEWVNAAWERRTGYTLAEAAGQRPCDLLDLAALNPEAWPPLCAALEAGQPARAELLNRARDGREYWVDLDIQPLRDAVGRLHGFMAVEVEISARKAQGAALTAAAAEAERARAALVSAVEALRHGFAWYDAGDRLVLCNARYRGLIVALDPLIRPGVRFEDILRAGIARGVFAGARGREDAFIAERLAVRRQPESELELELADGRWLRVVERVTPDGGRVGLWIDITQLKTAELRALEERAAAMDASRDGIALTDAQGDLIYMNAAHRAMFGIAPDEDIRGRNWRDLYAPEEADAFAAAAAPALQTVGSWRGEVVGRRPDGAAVEQELSLTRRTDGGVLVISRDISARRRADQEHSRLREELQLAQRREAIGQLAAGLAHDFNNLLATIGGSAALARGRLPLDHAGQPHLARIEAATRQAAALVRRMLRLGARRTRREWIDLRMPLREAADLVGAGLGPGLRLRMALPRGPAMAAADPTDILQIVLNLALNARDALGAGPGEIVLSLNRATPAMLAGPFVAGGVPGGEAAAAAEGAADDSGTGTAAGFWAISVADTGPGMASEAAARLFRPYVTTKGPRGSGLGLAIVAGVVAANRGAVALDTAPGRGARFTVIWPGAPAGDGPGRPGAAPDAAPAPETTAQRPDPRAGASAMPDPAAPFAVRADPAPAQGRAAGPQASPDPARPGPARPGRALAGRAVLVVEDSPEMLEVLTAFLEASGARVAGTCEPADALEVLREDPALWDLLITDFDMTPISGADLAAAAHRLAPDLPVLLVTALPDWRRRIGAGAAHFAAAVAKPVTQEGLTSAARTALHWRR